MKYADAFFFILFWYFVAGLCSPAPLSQKYVFATAS